MFISYIKLGSSNLPPGMILIHLPRGRKAPGLYNIYILNQKNAYLEKLVNSPNLNFGAIRLVGSSPTVSNLE